VVHIRRFETQDGEAVKKLIMQIMDREFQEDKAVFAFDDLDALLNSYGNLGEAFFVAEESRRLVGTVGIKRENERIALLRRIFVDPEYRKKQIGLKLLNRAIEFCEDVGYRELVFRTTSRMTGAIELVKKQGFQPRAKVPMGQIELLKFTLSLKGPKS
jgi:N-acetylglutamate synthase-like GNAT family acetyltransferase